MVIYIAQLVILLSGQVVMFSYNFYYCTIQARQPPAFLALQFAGLSPSTDSAVKQNSSNSLSVSKISTVATPFLELWLLRTLASRHLAHILGKSRTKTSDAEANFPTLSHLL